MPKRQIFGVKSSPSQGKMGRFSLNVSVVGIVSQC